MTRVLKEKRLITQGLGYAPGDVNLVPFLLFSYFSAG